jgi:hypothetical protein
MTDNTELQRLIRLSRLGRQIAARLPGDHELHGYLRELSARAPRQPTSNKAVLYSAAESGAPGERRYDDVSIG